CMIHEEQLPLVVAKTVAHARVTVNDLLRTTDRERSLVSELLKGGTMAVDGCIVKIRSEFVDSILRLLAHKDLTAEPNNGLVGAAVTVMFEALTIQVDELHVVLFGPENVVREEAVTVVGSLLCNLRGADAAVP